MRAAADPRRNRRAAVEFDKRLLELKEEAASATEHVIEIIESATKRKLTAADRQQLDEALYSYDLARQSEEYNRQSALNELARLASSFANSSSVASLTAEQYEALVRKLTNRALPVTAKRGKGKPPQRDLRALVIRLASYWEGVTGQRFKPHWKRTTRWLPGNPATAFIHACAMLVAAERVGSLRKMTTNPNVLRAIAAARGRR